MVIWNGYVFKGPEIEKLFQQMPGTSHEVLSLDVQSLSLRKKQNLILKDLLSQQGTVKNILVTTNGYVEYGGDESTKALFSEQFVLAEDQQKNFYVASNTFRWVKQ
jgi:hypothetical protein